MSVKRKVSSNAVAFDNKLSKGIISGLSALDDIEGLMIEEESTQLISRPDPGQKSVSKAQKDAAVKALKPKKASKPKPSRAASQAPVKPSSVGNAGKNYRQSAEYKRYEEMQVLSGSDEELIEVSFYLDRQQMRKVKNLLQQQGLATPEQVFNPGFGPHRQMVVPRLALREYSDLLGKGIELLYEAQFALEGKSIADTEATQIADYLMKP